jgi:hypothetical protein
MDMPLPIPESFRDIFCAQYGVPTNLYGPTVLRITLYPHARWLAELSPHEFLGPDRSFVAAVGRLTRWRSFAGEVRNFQERSENRLFWRRRLRLRVSVARMSALFSEVMGAAMPSVLDESNLRDASQCEPGSFVAD